LLNNSDKEDKWEEITKEDNTIKDIKTTEEETTITDKTMVECNITADTTNRDNNIDKECKDKTLRCKSNSLKDSSTKGCNSSSTR